MNYFLNLLFCGTLLPTVLFAEKGTQTDTTALTPKTAIIADTASLLSDSATTPQSAAVDSAFAGAITAKRDSTLHPASAKKTDGAPAAAAERVSTRKIKLIKREYNYRQQVGLAVGMMAFIAIIMSTAQSCNPK